MSHPTANTEIRPFLWEFTKEEISKQAEEQLGETPEKVRDGIAELKKYIKKKRLPVCEDDEFLLKFLRVKKFRISDSCQTFEDFNTSLRLFYEKFGPIDLDIVELVLKKNIFCVLPYRDPEGRVNLCYRFGILFEQGLCGKDSMKAAEVALFAMIEQSSSQTLGMNYILDCTGISLAEIRDGIDLWILYARYLAKQPFRVHRAEIIHESYLFRLCLNLLRPFLPAKILQKIHLHGDDLESSFFKHYEKSAIPDELGGTGGTITNEHWSGKLHEVAEQFIKMQENVISHNC